VLNRRMVTSVAMSRLYAVGVTGRRWDRYNRLEGLGSAGLDWTELGSWVNGEDYVPSMAWIDEIERCQPLQLKPLLPEHSFRVPLPADTSGADGCKRIVIFLNGDTLIARKEQTRFVRYEGKISQ
jgi:hypothetical protein